MAHTHETEYSDADLEQAKRLFSEILERLEQIDQITARTMMKAHPGLTAEVLKGPAKKIIISPDWFLRRCAGSGEGMCICQDFNSRTCRVCSSRE
jgi:hypothetical protein